MTDATQLSREWERRERRAQEEQSAVQPLSPHGMFSVWLGLKEMLNGQDPIMQSIGRIQLKDSGAIIVYDDDMNTEILFPWPGAYFNFVIDREG